MPITKHERTFDVCSVLSHINMEILNSMGSPVIDIGPCILCEICVELAPHAFQINDAGFVEVLPLVDYSDEDIHEALKNCPKDCISRE